MCVNYSKARFQRIKSSIYNCTYVITQAKQLSNHGAHLEDIVLLIQFLFTISDSILKKL